LAFHLDPRRRVPQDHPRQRREIEMEYLHTMVRVSNLEESLDFYCNKLGLVETRRTENEKGRYTLVFLAAPGDLDRAQETRSPLVELTYNWDEHSYQGGRNFGHLAYRVDDIYATCQKLMNAGVTINRPPRDGYMAFVRSPDGISFELLQKGEAKPPQEPWLSMPNTGS
jgi:lactoylglutathione lyase